MIKLYKRSVLIVKEIGDDIFPNVKLEDLNRKFIQWGYFEKPWRQLKILYSKKQISFDDFIKNVITDIEFFNKLNCVDFGSFDILNTDDSFVTRVSIVNGKIKTENKLELHLTCPEETSNYKSYFKDLKIEEN